MQFIRFCIKGTLTTRTPLHIGNGDTTKHTDKNLEGVEISAVAKDYQDRAYLPGTVIKGNLRSWLVRNKAEAKLIESVFGSENPDTKYAVGGKIEFCDALYSGNDISAINVPYWRPDHLTSVTVSVGINRRTRTAAKSNLRHEEFVPPGISFDVELTGQEVTDDEAALLLFAVDGFNDDVKNDNEPVTLGADTGDIYGRFTWKLMGMSKLNEDDVRQWLTQEKPPVGYRGLLPLDEKTAADLKSRAVNKFHRDTGAVLKISLNIQFESMFLVNDPSRVIKKQTADFLPLRNSQGQILLPAKSMRGAIRSQAEKILRTLNHDSACLEDNRCPSIYDREDLKRLCLACRLFGASGWRTPVEFSDFTPVSGTEGTPFPQEFVAIDRFTGGSAGSFKFNAEPQYHPVLNGTIKIDLCKVEPWEIGLFARVLKDLIEGDILLGFGSGKGYAGCQATVKGIYVSGSDCHPAINALLGKYGLTVEQINRVSLTDIPPDIRSFLQNCLEEFNQTVSSYRRNPVGKGGI
jgi:CRISPR/Cas system CSM-associated protein Csm3 (group 7 of RAMP superfamily)